MAKKKKYVLTKNEENEKAALKQILSMSDQELENEIYTMLTSKKRTNHLEKTHGKEV